MKNYLKNCRILFPIYGKQERIFLKKLKRQIEDYCVDFPNATYTDIVTQFGTPTDVVISYYENTNETLLLKRANLIKYLRSFLLCLLILVLIFLIHFGFWTYQAYLDAKDTIIIHEKTEIYENAF